MSKRLSSIARELEILPRDLARVCAERHLVAHPSLSTRVSVGEEAAIRCAVEEVFESERMSAARAEESGEPRIYTYRRPLWLRERAAIDRWRRRGSSTFQPVGCVVAGAIICSVPCGLIGAGIAALRSSVPRTGAIWGVALVAIVAIIGFLIALLGEWGSRRKRSRRSRSLLDPPEVEVLRIEADRAWWVKAEEKRSSEDQQMRDHVLRVADNRYVLIPGDSMEIPTFGEKPGRVLEAVCDQKDEIRCVSVVETATQFERDLLTEELSEYTYRFDPFMTIPLHDIRKCMRSPLWDA